MARHHGARALCRARDRPRGPPSHAACQRCRSQAASCRAGQSKGSLEARPPATPGTSRCSGCEAAVTTTSRGERNGLASKAARPDGDDLGPGRLEVRDGRPQPRNLEVIVGARVTEQPFLQASQDANADPLERLRIEEGGAVGTGQAGGLALGAGPPIPVICRLAVRVRTACSNDTKTPAVSADLTRLEEPGDR